jgi:hypothetical protein
MAFYTMIGFIVIAAIIAAGVYWVVTHISFMKQVERFDRYTYMKDEAENEYVRDNTKDKSDV